MPCCQDRRKGVAYTWYIIAFISIAYTVAAIAAAAHNNEAVVSSATALSAAGFGAIWSMILLIVILIFGTLTMKGRYKGSKIATGVFLGVSLMFAQMELLLFAIFVDLGQESGGAEAASNKAFASFALFMAVLYGIFSAFLYSVREVVSGDEESDTQGLAKEELA